MLKNQNPVTMWVPEATRTVYSQIATVTGEQQYQVAQRLAERELKRVERQQQKGGTQK
jgi:bifunctional N-acetylglucosamine-1-phosphate-uridyltransferase/glucosamine-1-phosphate-acetyltransferase GlmU-like protein